MINNILNKKIKLFVVSSYQRSNISYVLVNVTLTVMFIVTKLFVHQRNLAKVNNFHKIIILYINIQMFQQSQHTRTRKDLCYTKYQSKAEY